MATVRKIRERPVLRTRLHAWLHRKTTAGEERFLAALVRSRSVKLHYSHQGAFDYEEDQVGVPGTKSRIQAYILAVLLDFEGVGPVEIVEKLEAWLRQNFEFSVN